MTTIQIVDTAHPRDALTSTTSHEATSTGAEASGYTIRRLGRSETTDSRDGIYNIRSRSTVPIDRQRRRTLTIEDGDPGIRKEGDFKQQQARILA